jgi:hypothetical protein
MKTQPENNPKANSQPRHPEQAKRAEVPSVSDNPIKQHANCASCL